MRPLPLVILAVLAAAIASPPAAGQGITMRLSGDIIIPAGTVHDGPSVTMNGRIVVDGTLAGDAMTMNGDVTVAGTVRGSVRAFNGDITLADTAVVEGDVWTANGTIDRQPGAQVRGRVQSQTGGPPGPPPSSPAPGSPAPPGSSAPPGSFPPPMRPDRWDRDWDWWWPGVVRTMAMGTFIGFIALAAAAGAIFPVQVRRVAEVLVRSPGESILAGFLLWVALPPLAIILALSVVGIPVVVFLPFAVLLLGLAGLAGASQLIGDRILGGFQRQHHTALEAVVGAVLLGALAFIPGLGWLALFAAFTWGVGGIVLLIMRRIRGTPAAASPSP